MSPTHCSKQRCHLFIACRPSTKENMQVFPEVTCQCPFWTRSTPTQPAPLCSCITNHCAYRAFLPSLKHSAQEVGSPMFISQMPCQINHINEFYRKWIAILNSSLAIILKKLLQKVFLCCPPKGHKSPLYVYKSLKWPFKRAGSMFLSE